MYTMISTFPFIQEIHAVVWEWRVGVGSSKKVVREYSLHDI
jgi:hypothetical protein